MSVCNLCQAGHASSCPLANRESEQTAPRDALVFGRWLCITFAAKCNIERFALSGLVHPHRDFYVQTVLPRSCIYVSPCLLRGRTSCTMRCFGAWELAMHHARRGSNSTFGANAPKRRCLCAICAKQIMHLRVLLLTERVNTLHHALLWFGCWQCITYAAKCNIERFALSGLVHPHSDACVQTVLPRSCIYVSPCLLRGRTGCTIYAMLWSLGAGNPPRTPRQ